jgi:hypothetical protein
MSQDEKSSYSRELIEHPLVERSRMLDDGKQAFVKVMGYLGRDTSQDMWRVYFTKDCNTYVRVAATDIVKTEPHPGETGQFARTDVYVKSTTELEQVTLRRREEQAAFLGGTFVRGVRNSSSMPPVDATGASTYLCLSLVSISVVTVTVTHEPEPPPTQPCGSMASCCLCWTPEAFC